jgi:hypothetical protein
MPRKRHWCNNRSHLLFLFLYQWLPIHCAGKLVVTRLSPHFVNQNGMIQHTTKKQFGLSRAYDMKTSNGNVKCLDRR